MSKAVVVSTPKSVVVHSHHRRAVVACVGGATKVAIEEQPKTVVVVRGVPGPAGDASGALLIGNRLSEFDTPAAREQAQANLGLSVVDPLAYYILAKA